MASEKQHFRHEFKYLISTAQVSLLRSRIAEIMQPDPHVDYSGIYQVRSLYFDDYYNKCYFENENGTDPREKFRIRIYNSATEWITLECKNKNHGMTLKKNCSLTKEQAEILTFGKPLPDEGNLLPLQRKLNLQMQTNLLKPAVIVEYERIPYVCPNGNVRITFDLNIAAAANTQEFFSKNLSKRPIMPTGQQLMEVKFDEYLPDYIYRNLNLGSLRQTTYSKYYLCRKYR